MTMRTIRPWVRLTLVSRACFGATPCVTMIGTAYSQRASCQAASNANPVPNTAASNRKRRHSGGASAR